MQQGDCNAGATYQTLMNHIFASYIGVFVYIYLDDIIIFSDTIEDHVKHIQIVFDILQKEKLYLGPLKMQFFAEELKILGHIIDDRGISMDLHKVDKVLNWKAPTNKCHRHGRLARLSLDSFFILLSPTLHLPSLILSFSLPYLFT